MKKNAILQCHAYSNPIGIHMNQILTDFARGIAKDLEKKGMSGW
jgi:hypothetical protein